MEPLIDILELVAFLVPVAAVTGFVVVALYGAHLVLLGRPKDLAGESRLGRQAAMFALTAVGVALIVLSLPVPDSTKAQLLSILGLVLTAVLGVSSTTFVSNAMAGLMLRALHRFELGDFIEFQDYLGRITERGLFYTEIQTKDRDLVTLPNLSLVSNPFKLFRSSGTIVSASVTLGYDVPHHKVHELLLEAATKAELTDPFVRIVDLGDFSVKYKIAGLLTDVKRLLIVRSSLRRCMLDSLHGSGVEIVSPAFMNQRILTPDVTILPAGRGSAPAPEEDSPSVVFDKADAASHVADLRKKLDAITEEIEALKERRKSASDEDHEALDREIEDHERRRDWIQKAVETAQNNLANDKD